MSNDGKHLNKSSPPLQDAQTLADVIFEHAGALALILDRNGRIVRFNRACEELSGYSFSEVKGKYPWDTFLPSEDAEEIKASTFDAMTNHPQVLSGKYTNYWEAKDGRRYLTDWHNTLLMNTSGQLEFIISVGNDVTERERMATQLRESEERLRLVIDATNDGIWDWNPLTHEDYLSPRWKEILGYKNNELPNVDSSFFNLIHPDDRERVSKAVQQHFDENIPYHTQLRMKHKDGSYRWILTRGEAVRDSDGNPVRMVGSITDVTCQKLAEASIAGSREQLNEAQRIARVGSWELNLLTNERAWSDEIYRILEVDKTQVEASYEVFINTVHSDDRDKLIKTYRDSLATHSPYEIIYRLKMTGGRIKYVRGKSESYYDDNGNPIRSMGTIQDITDIYLAEQELHQHREHLEELVAERAAQLAENERKLREAQKIAHLGYANLNTATGISDWSEETYHIHGVTPANHQPNLGNYLSEIVHPDDVARLHENLKLASDIEQQNRVHSIDYRIRRPDGEERWVYAKVISEWSLDGTLYLRSVLQDITQRKQTEAAMMEALDQAQRASKAKSEFLSRMSHELRTPMNAILGFTQLLEMEDLSEEQLDSVQEIDRAGNHLLELINELLELSRIESGNFAMAIRPVALQSVVNEAINIVKPLVAENGITLLNHCKHSLNVLADPVRLRQILVNLLSNAAKYNHYGGCIILDDQHVTKHRIRLSITDTGPGIVPESIPLLFTPFERMGAEYSSIEGTGVGLALSKQLANLMDVMLGFDSKLGKGSTFWLDLPLTADNDDTQEGVSRVPGTVNVDGNYTVLYIEDNGANLRLVESLFRHFSGLTLVSANTGKYGLELAKRYKPEIILLDIHLPDIDGFTILKILQGDSETQHIPVLALTADALPVDIERGLKAGFRHYITKPIQVNELRDALVALITEKTG